MVPDRGHGGGRWRFFGTLETESGGTETRAAVKKGYPSTLHLRDWGMDNQLDTLGTANFPAHSILTS
jgi:hypothetical protein